MFSAVTRTVFKASARSINGNKAGAIVLTRSYAAEATNRAENKLRLTVATPAGPLASYQDMVVEKVKIPGSTGDYTVLANHVPYISELRPGIVTIVKDDKTEERYFTSGGFAFVHRDSTCNINAVEM
jgi:F-type H+-transporting ATPase subunit delta